MLFFRLPFASAPVNSGSDTRRRGSTQVWKLGLVAQRVAGTRLLQGSPDWLLPGWQRVGCTTALLMGWFACLALAGGEPDLTQRDTLPRVEEGQIQLLPGPLPMQAGRVLPLLYNGHMDSTAEALTAGELWSFFRQQGLAEVSSIVLFLDVDKFSGPEPLRIQSIEFRIEPRDASSPLTCCSLDESKGLTISCDDSLAAAPEARLEIPLEYDFMQRFSAESSERIFLKIAFQAPAGSEPSFFVAGRTGWLTLPSFPLLIGFVLFWGVVFFTLFRLTLKSPGREAVTRRVS